ncbi:hypothetical protein [Cognatishimia maritima]|uniref:Uncharacterized protein n=1 Tax=Cognatishimia maritima TaxID=870908 RepID=A0A1M5V3N2_9RHOB|nr:hypothetical protein [Cognatishimia maritima]SHH69718.1 hypothetical protein SAMN04488044_3066 [Cognatishimia maritima]
MTLLPEPQRFNLLLIGQAGRLTFEAVLLLASLRAKSPDFPGRIFVAEPAEGPLWDTPPCMRNSDARALLEKLGAEIIPFESLHFGTSYPNGNKIEALFALPEGEPFLFLDTDTLITGDLARVPFDFDRPSASGKVEGTWPIEPLYGPGYYEIWKALYDRFDLDFESSQDQAHRIDHWRRYLYFNAGFFYYKCPRAFGERFLQYALSIRDDTPDALASQKLTPWLDQIALPLVIHSLGGGRDALPQGLMDGAVTCHYRFLPLLYAREADHVVRTLEEVSAPNDVKRVLKQYDPFKFMVYHGRGLKARALFDRASLPRKEQAIRNRLRRNGYWMR